MSHRVEENEPKTLAQESPSGVHCVCEKILVPDFVLREQLKTSQHQGVEFFCILGCFSSIKDLIFRFGLEGMIKKVFVC